MSTSFVGPEPSDGLRIKKVSFISSTDGDMIRRRAGNLRKDLFHGPEQNTHRDLLPEFLYE